MITNDGKKKENFTKKNTKMKLFQIFFLNKKNEN
jgi:hypothetical protein